MKQPEMDQDTLFIFTDASLFNYKGVEYITCSGAIACCFNEVRQYRIIDESFKINRCSTNNNGEIKAVYEGILLAIKWKDKFKNICLFSDSKISIFGLREWIGNWVKLSNSDQLIGTNNEPIANQNDILSCIYMIMTNNLSIKLYHQKGHVSRKKIMSLALETYVSNNDINEFVESTFMHFITNMNEYVDKKSREILTEFVNKNMMGEPLLNVIPTISFIYTPFNIKYYMGLVNN